MPICSVIVPVYNAAVFIERCVNSVLSQDFNDYELILVDDGSLDDSGYMCDKLALRDKRIKVVHQCNGGPSKARNAGIKVCVGKFITFIDSDDYVSKEYLSSFLMNDDIDIEIQGFTLTYQDGRDDVAIVPSSTFICSISELLEETEPNGLVRGPVCKLFKTSIIKEHDINFPNNLRYGEDAIFVKKYLLYCNKGRLISRANYIYTHSSPLSLTSSFHKGWELMDATKEDFFLLSELRRKNPINQSTWNIFLSHKAIDFFQAVYNTMIDSCITNQEKQEFLKEIDTNLYQSVRNVKSLPPVFRIIRFVLAAFSRENTIKILTMILKNR